MPQRFLLPFKLFPQKKCQHNFNRHKLEAVIIINSRVPNFEMLYLSFLIVLFLSFSFFVRLGKNSPRAEEKVHNLEKPEPSPALPEVSSNATVDFYQHPV